MKVADLRKAVTVMTEDMLLGLYEELTTLAGHPDPDDIGRYRAKMEVVEIEIDKPVRPHVDAVLARKPNYWLSM